MDGVKILGQYCSEQSSFYIKKFFLRGRAGKKLGLNLIMQYYNCSKFVKAQDSPKELIPVLVSHSGVCVCVIS